MNNQQRSNFANFLFVGFFVLQILAMFLYTPCETYAELVEKNGLSYQLDTTAWFAFVLGAFLISSGSNKGVIRVILVAVTYTTINEFTGLNSYLYLFEYPVFWSLMVITTIYSIVKHRK
jgi:hypothetical protein